MTVDPSTLAPGPAQAFAAGVYWGDGRVDGTDVKVGARHSQLRAALDAAGIAWRAQGSTTVAVAAQVAPPSPFTVQAAAAFLAGILAVEGGRPGTGLVFDDPQVERREPVGAALRVLGVGHVTEGGKIRAEVAGLDMVRELVPVVDWDRWPGTVPPPDPDTPPGHTGTVSERLWDVALELLDLSAQVALPPPKPLPTGLVERHGRVDTAEAFGLAGVVVRSSWAECATSEGRVRVGMLLDQIHGRGLWAFLRLGGMAVAPDWVKDLGAGPLALANGTDPGLDPVFTVARHWDVEVFAAWWDDIHEIAAAFDDHPALAGVCVGYGGGLHGEPLVRWPENRAVYRTAGLTPDADLAAIGVGVHAAKVAFVRTPVVVAVNPYSGLDDGGTRGLDPCFALGDVADMVQNHGLGRDIAGQRANLYSWLSTRRFGFQTETLDRLDAAGRDLRWCVEQAAAYRALHVELPMGWESRLTATAVAELTEVLRGGTQPRVFTG